MRMLVVSLVFATALVAQRGGRMGGGGFRGSPGHGHGGGFTNPIGGGYNRGFIGGPTYRFGGYRGGFYPFTSFGRARYGVNYYGYGYYPYSSLYAAPFWGMSSAYAPYYDYAYQYAASPAVTVVTTPEVQAAPSTIIIYNSPPGRPPAQEYREETTRAPERRSAGPLIYLIAANDGIVWAATSYRTESGVLHFVTTKGEQKQMPLSRVDRELSEQFNRERGVPFQLP